MPQPVQERVAPPAKKTFTPINGNVEAELTKIQTDTFNKITSIKTAARREMSRGQMEIIRMTQSIVEAANSHHEGQQQGRDMIDKAFQQKRIDRKSYIAALKDLASKDTVWA